MKNIRLKYLKHHNLCLRVNSKVFTRVLESDFIKKLFQKKILKNLY